MSFRVPMGAGAQRKSCRTPRKERPAAAAAPLQDANVPIEFVLEDASQFPQLPDGGAMPRGRKARRSHTAWNELGVPVRTQSLSRERRPVNNEASERIENSRARAYSHDAGVEAFADTSAPTTPRSCLKKKERPVAPAVEDKEAEELLEQMARVQRALMAKGYDQAEVGLKLNMKISSMPLDPAPAPAATASSSAEGAEEQDAVRPRRMSNPGQGVAFELPTGNSWDFPLTKTEKQARFAMISSHEIEYLEEQNAALEEENADLKQR